MGPVHGSWWRTSSSTRVLGDTPSVRGPRGPEPLQWLQRLQTLESLQDPDFDRGVFRAGGVKEKNENDDDGNDDKEEQDDADAKQDLNASIPAF